MFENVLHQSCTILLSNDIINNNLPNSLLFSGVASQGKLTTALELARVLSCTGSVRGDWSCTCSSCCSHKSLTNPDLLILGPRYNALEIIAAKSTFLQAVANRSSHMNASRYLFIRSARKLTARFNPILWEGDTKVSKVSPLVTAVDEQLELISPTRDIPDFDDLEKICEAVTLACIKLEESALYDTIPIAHIRRAATWAHLTTGGKTKVLIIENADCMQEGSRNALLKILEEPPQQVIFILTTERRNAIMPTILSRVRTYSFAQRSIEQQQEVISRLFHIESSTYNSVGQFLYSLLPVPLSKLSELAQDFLDHAKDPPIDLCQKTISNASNFEPRFLYRLFILQLLNCLRKKMLTENVTPSDISKIEKYSQAVQRAFTQVYVYNQSPVATLELLLHEFAGV